MGRNNQRLLPAILVFGLAATCGPAGAEMVLKKIDPNERDVSLVRQDQSDCNNSNVSDRYPAEIGGTALVVRGTDGITRVKVGIIGKPNTTYQFHLKCVRILGDVKTYGEGEGGGTFEFKTDTVGNVYAFDMYPEGAHPGDKYQSVQVKFD